MVIEASIMALYESRYGTRLVDRLGAGANGQVHSTDRLSAVKFFYSSQDRAYQRERRAYTVLAEKNLREVLGHRVPRMLRRDDELRMIEMSIVRPPYLLDFASAYFPEDVPDFPEEVWEQHFEDLRERFGERWDDAERVIDEFTRRSGLVLLDAHAANLRFA